MADLEARGWKSRKKEVDREESEVGLGREGKGTVSDRT